ncbi:hypothetical protein JIY74_31200 [Vibrio harveyi]|nr:hypothetical protein [Vibrio harveyi]
MILFFYYKSLVLLIPFSLPLILNFLLALIHRKVYATIQNANKLSKQQQEETKKLDEKKYKTKIIKIILNNCLTQAKIKKDIKLTKQLEDMLESLET